MKHLHHEYDFVLKPNPSVNTPITPIYFKEKKKKKMLKKPILIDS